MGTSSTRAKNKYNENNYDRIALVVPKGQKEIIKQHAEQCGESLNGFIVRAINAEIQRDKQKTPFKT